LKEEKECNVVMIFHKGELEEQDNNSAINDKEKQAKQDNSKNWYQTYKEKIIDYEFIINDNSKAAHNIISNEVKYDKEVQNIIFECYQNSCN
ncbi:hypothetical protein FW507_09705, partial [Campylobacter jejuni]|nr:hypothetical protein [Campylobacter jejuni]